ncbi:fimbria/pilus outer membrane usher protein [Bartonella sp. HY761]|uniref:fimbria/pilus outer membrane usher protein n=1 Tax=Bartonella sp. HY761 TaxID=2979330 RepID=UPI002206B22A|nr:fimbria/pilus outer membrane usher protein [Bartonella sp. HY761]UXN06884.1 fimbria/pilus outer membrane usher protein [Bartonella sp. HY761]
MANRPSQNGKFCFSIRLFALIPLAVGFVISSLSNIKAQNASDDTQWVLVDDIADLNNSASTAPVADPTPEEEPNYQATTPQETIFRNSDIYVYISLNGEIRQGMFAVRQGDGGVLMMRDRVLRKIGLLPQRLATNKEGWVTLDKLRAVKYDYNTITETLEFVTTDKNTLAPFVVSLDPQASAARENDENGIKPQSDLAALFNYSIYADSGNNKFDNLWNFQGISATVDSRITGKFGTFYTSELIRYSSQGFDGDKTQFIHLDSYWTFSDEKRMLTYQIGDVITRSLAWSRSTRLGGIQLRRNFSLRDNLVTMALPELTGSAAVPSSVDLYLNTAQRSIENVPSGPFSLTDMPVLSGPNNARLVLRDALGRETVQNLSFYASADLLARGLWDFSLEAGTPRRNYGSESADYTKDFFVSGTFRYGLTNRLTLEGHGEIGSSFYNGGIGAIFTIADFAQLSLAGSASNYQKEIGQQLNASVQFQRWGIVITGLIQRNFGDFNDMALIVDRKANERLSGNSFNLDNLNAVYSSQRFGQLPKAINQLSWGTSLHFDPTNITVNFTETIYHDQNSNRFISLSANRSFGNKLNGYAAGFKNLNDDKKYSFFAGLSYRFDNGIGVSTGVNNDYNSTRIDTRIYKNLGSNVGDVGWSIKDSEGKGANRRAEGQYRTSIALLSASVDQYDDKWRATLSADGGIVFADGTLIPTQRVNDAFAVINAGISGVGVMVDNQNSGKTWGNGRYVAHNLSSYNTTSIALDMETMPEDAIVEATEIMVRPAQMTGVIVNFGGSGSNKYLYVSFKETNGNFVEVGSLAQVVGTDIAFDIGYDGSVIIPLTKVKLPATLHIMKIDGSICEAVLLDNIATGINAGLQTISCKTIRPAQNNQ